MHCFEFHFQTKVYNAPPPPPSPPLSQLVSITGSSLPRSQQQALARRKLKQTLKATEKERKILACIPQYSVLLWRCPDTLSCYGGVLIEVLHCK